MADNVSAAKSRDLEMEKLRAENEVLRNRVGLDDFATTMQHVAGPSLPHHGEPLVVRVPNIESDLGESVGRTLARLDEHNGRLRELERVVFGSGHE